MKFLMVVVTVLMSTSAFAGEICENYAKYFAIRDYKSKATGVQGSDGIVYDSELISITPNAEGEEYLYTVSISENNEDGDYWTWYYEVVVSKLPNSEKCSLKKIDYEIAD